MVPSMWSSTQCSSSHCTMAYLERVLAAAALAVIACAVCSPHGVAAFPTYDFLFKMPPDQPSMFPEDNECNLRPEVETLCQRCAKSTKSNVVYPMCCEDKEEAREWCERYINFGIQ